MRRTGQIPGQIAPLGGWMGLRHVLAVGVGAHAATVLLQALSIHDLITAVGQTRGFAPHTAGIIVSVRLGNAALVALVAVLVGPAQLLG